MSVMLMSAQAFSAELPKKTDAQFPYIAPQNCLAGLRSPDNSNGAVYSKNCQYAFVLPPATGTEKLSNFAPSSNIMFCEDVLANSTTINKYRQIAISNLERVADLIAKNPNDPLIDRLNKMNQEFSKEVERLSRQYAAIESASVSVSLDGTTSDRDMASWREANSQLIEMTGTVFTRAPISQGYISFDAINATEGDKKLDPAVLRTTIPGFKNGQESTDVVFGGHLEGQLKLSLKGACGILKSTKIEMPVEAELDVAKAASILVANYTYAVPVQTGVSYTANLQAKEVTQALQNISVRHGQFTVESLMNVKSSDSQSSLCEVKYREYELPADSGIKQTFEAGFSSSICATLISGALEKLAARGVVSQMQTLFNTLPADAPGGMTSTTERRGGCHVSFGKFGIPSGGCGDQTYTTQSWQDGGGAKFEDIISEVAVTLGQSVELETVLMRWNTMGFVPQI